MIYNGCMMSDCITYCFSHSLVLTRRCANACGYCDFNLLPSPSLPSRKRLDQVYRQGARLGAVEMEIISGEGLSEHREIQSVLRYYGISDFQSYLQQAITQAMQTNGHLGLLPVANVGPISTAEIERLKRFLPCLKIMLPSIDTALMNKPAHRNAPSKNPETRLQAILDAGAAGVTVSSGMLIGIGESVASREATLRVLLRAHERYGHIQNIIIERFKPRPGTLMADWPECPQRDVLEVARTARRIFGPDMPLTFPVLEEVELLDEAVAAGIDDFGEVRLSADPAQNEQTLQRLALVRLRCHALGRELNERLPLFPPFQNEKWLSPSVLELVRAWNEANSAEV